MLVNVTNSALFFIKCDCNSCDRESATFYIGSLERVKEELVKHDWHITNEKTLCPNCKKGDNEK